MTPVLPPDRSPERPSRVAPAPRDVCLAPLDSREALQACVHARWTAAGYGWELSVVDNVVECESGWNPGAQGDRNRAKGLFQIRIDVHYGRRPPEWWAADLWADPVENTELALELRSESGWSPWSCARVGGKRLG